MKAMLIAVCMVLLVGTAQASTNDVIQACARKDTGALRMSGISGCRKTENPVQWNAQGPQGPAGQDGQDGTKATFQMESGIYQPEEGEFWVNIPCEHGMMAIGGSAWIGDAWSVQRPLAVELTENGGFRDYAHIAWNSLLTPDDILFYNVTCGAV